MLRVKVRWSGFIGSPGWSNFYFDDTAGGFEDASSAVACADRVATFLTANRLKFPAAVQWTIQSDVEQITPSTGEMHSVVSAGARAAITGGAAAGSYSGASGVCITWRTAGVRNGRRVRGRTFLVPTANNIYQSDGTIDGTHLNEFVNSANALADQAAVLKLGVWCRPTVTNGVPNEDGAFHPITSASVPDMAAVLRSRRG